jgi:uncharacterized protein (AIM24 family)
MFLIDGTYAVNVTVDGKLVGKTPEYPGVVTKIDLMENEVTVLNNGSFYVVKGSVSFIVDIHKLGNF